MDAKSIKTEGNSDKHNNSRYKDVVVHNRKICILKMNKDRNEFYQEVANMATIKEVIENKDTKDIKAVLVCDDGHDIKELKVELSDITTKIKIIKLVDKGLDVDETNANYVIRHLRNERENAPKVYTHSKLGFIRYDNTLFYNHYKIIGKKMENDIKSTYDGEILVKPKGSAKAWMDMVKNSVLGNVEMELALVIGFSAAMVGYLGKENLFIHIFGDSSGGKTTAAMLAISAFGSPNQLDRGLFLTWNSTSNAMHEVIGGNTGIPVLFDESSMSNIKDVTNLIYSLTTGKNKSRMTKDGNMRESKVWKTTIISTGEDSLTSKSSEFTGIRARLFEFGNFAWTKNAAHSEVIKETVLNNYGHYGKIFARHLLSYGKRKVKEVHRECLKRLKENMTDSQLKDRIAEKFALIIATAEIMREAMKININIAAIEKMLIDNDSASLEDKDIANKALDIIMAEVAENRAKFGLDYEYSKEHKLMASDSKTWGIIEYVGTRQEHSMRIVIIKKELERILKDNHFEEPKVIIRKWKQRGLLDYEDKKTYRKRTINGIPGTHCYVIKIPKDMESEDEGNADYEKRKGNEQMKGKVNHSPFPRKKKSMNKK